jgi:hypothetical protein
MTDASSWDDLGLVTEGPPISYLDESVAASSSTVATSKPSQATEIMFMARSRYNVVRGDDGKSYAVAHDQPGVAFGLRGTGGLRQQLAATFFDEKNRVASGSALQDALATIEGEAMRGPETTVHLRCGRHGEGIIIDRADPRGHVIEVTASGWRELERSPILFRRTNVSLQFPEPAKLGDLDAMRELLNVNESAFRLVVGFIVAAWIPDIPHPILALMGEQGVAKSSAARLVLSLIDPSAASLVSQPDSSLDWAVNAYNVYAIGLDNVSHMRPWLQDALCKAVTGDVFVRRELYSDDGLSPMKFRRAIVLTTIDPGALQGDVADRLMPIELERIAKYRADREVTAAAEAARPVILAGMLELLAGVLRELPNIDLEHKPRMADFAEVLAALDVVTGWTTLDDYMASTRSAARDVVDGDSFAGAVVKFVDARGYWEGTCQQLLSKLTTDGAQKGWPETARAIAARVKRLSPALRSAGIEVERREERSRDGAIYRLQRLNGRPCESCKRPLSIEDEKKSTLYHPTCNPILHDDQEPF